MSADIATDHEGRATYGGKMAGDYNAAWHEQFPGRWAAGELEPGTWCKDAKGRWWWVTDTPAWDCQWFYSQGVWAPARIGGYEHFTWKDLWRRAVRWGLRSSQHLPPRAQGNTAGQDTGARGEHFFRAGGRT